MEETWKDITYLGVELSVSSLGKIFNKETNKLQHQGNRNGYLCISLKNKSILSHRIVATAFHSNPNNKPCVNHLNGKKNDNMAANLEWCTSEENIKHAWVTNLHDYMVFLHLETGIFYTPRELADQFYILRDAIITRYRKGKLPGYLLT